MHCGCGFKYISSDLEGNGKSFSFPGQGIENCANTCRLRGGCTGFEYNHDGNENYKCGTYTGGHSNINGPLKSGWTSCINDMFIGRNNFEQLFLFLQILSNATLILTILHYFRTSSILQRLVNLALFGYKRMGGLSYS